MYRFILAVLAAMAIGTSMLTEAGPLPEVRNVYEQLFDGAVQLHVRGAKYLPNRLSCGTGWISHGRDGTTFIWTAGHVVTDAIESGKQTGEIFIKTPLFDATDTDFEDGYTVINAKVIRFAYDPKHEMLEDLAILTIKMKEYKKPLRLVSEDNYPRLGDKLILIGATGGRERGLFVTEGTLGRKDVKMGKFRWDYCNMSSLSGCSGGPVTDKNGMIVGMVTCGKGETFSWYIPSRRIKTWAKRMNAEFALNSELAIGKLDFKEDSLSLDHVASPSPILPFLKNP